MSEISKQMDAKSTAGLFMEKMGSSTPCRLKANTVFCSSLLSKEI